MNRLKQLAERRAFLLADSELQRERILLCAENVHRFFYESNLGRLFKSPARAVAGILIFRWITQKLGSLIAGRFAHQALEVASNIWRWFGRRW